MPQADSSPRARCLAGAALLGAALLASGGAPAQEATIAVPAGLVSLDPHASDSRPHAEAIRNIYETLVRRGPAMEIAPHLAESWRRIDDTIWEFRLRRDVRWHDGSPFTAEDVQHSLLRIPTIPTMAGTPLDLVRSLTAVVILDEHTLRLRTVEPMPTLAAELDRVFIMQARPNPTLQVGDAAVGTGPYRYVEWSPGRDLVLERSETYWGAKPHFTRVTFREIPDGAARVSALQAGEVDLVTQVPPAALPALQRAPGLRLVQSPTVHVLLLHPDGRPGAPAVTDAEGRPMEANPFRDQRVRRALSLALDRSALVRQALPGVAQPAAGPLPASFVGMPRDLPAPRHDPAEARRLLAEAGYPRGFRVRLDCTEGRYEGDARLCAAVAQALTAVGIAAEPAPQPPPAYFTAFSAGEVSLGLNAGDTPGGDATYLLAALLHSRGIDRRFGAFNRMRYSNPALDRLIARSFDLTDEAARGEMLEQAMRIAMQDQAVIPVATLLASWAFNPARLSFAPRMDKETPAASLLPPAR